MSDSWTFLAYDSLLSEILGTDIGSRRDLYLKKHGSSCSSVCFCLSRLFARRVSSHSPFASVSSSRAGPSRVRHGSVAVWSAASHRSMHVSFLVLEVEVVLGLRLGAVKKVVRVAEASRGRLRGNPARGTSKKKWSPGRSRLRERRDRARRRLKVCVLVRGTMRAPFDFGVSRVVAANHPRRGILRGRFVFVFWCWYRTRDGSIP